MKTLFVYCHPNEDSLNRQLLNLGVSAAKDKGHQVEVRDLYKLNFSPILEAHHLKQEIPSEDVLEEQKWVMWADILVFVYPIWWWQTPAVLKGWFDRVLSHGFAFEVGADGAKGLLSDKRALVLSTAANRKESYERGDYEESIRAIIADGTLGFCGIEDVRFMTLYGLYNWVDKNIDGEIESVEEFFKDHL